MDLIEEHLQETIDLTKSILKDAGLGPKDIDEILLVGGSTRIPRVWELISNLFGKEARKDIDPDETVALGGAVQAGLKSGILSKSGLIATDVAPFSMGISVMKEWKSFTLKPGGFAIIIPKNTTIPVTRSEKFTTTYDGQTEVSIEIYQGEHEWVQGNYKLGEFLLEGIPANAEGHELIEVKFRYNLNGILEVHGKCVSTGKEMIVTVQDALDRGSEKAFNSSMKKIESLFHEVEEEDMDLEEIFNSYKELYDGEIEDAQSWEDLEEEARVQIDNLNKIKKTIPKKQGEKADKLIQDLKEGIKDKDGDYLISAIEDTVDFFIDLEI